MTTAFDLARDNLALLISFASVPALLVGLANWLRLRKIRRFVQEHQERMIQWADLAAGLDTLDQIVAPDRRLENCSVKDRVLRDDLNRLRTAANMFRSIGRGNSNFLLIEARRLYEIGCYKEAANTYDRVLKRDFRLESLDSHEKRICFLEWQSCCLAMFDFENAVRIAEKSIEAGYKCCIEPEEVMRWRLRHVLRVRIRGIERKLAKSLPGGGKRQSFSNFLR